jgi:hypothetical protein
LKINSPIPFEPILHLWIQVAELESNRARYLVQSVGFVRIGSLTVGFYNPGGSRVLAQGAPSMIPNDPCQNVVRQEQMNFRQALYLAQQKELTTGPNMQDVVVLMLGTGVDYSVPDIVAELSAGIFPELHGWAERHSLG